MTSEGRRPNFHLIPMYIWGVLRRRTSSTGHPVLIACTASAPLSSSCDRAPSAHFTVLKGSRMLRSECVPCWHDDGSRSQPYLLLPKGCTASAGVRRHRKRKLSVGSQHLHSSARSLYATVSLRVARRWGR